MSLRNGLQKAVDKTQVGLDVAKEVAAEKVAVAKEVFDDWNEQRKDAAQRKAYNREKDMRFSEAADQALHGLEERGVTTPPTEVEDYQFEDDFETATPTDEISSATSAQPSSWKELAELEARNHAAETLADISVVSGDAQHGEAVDSSDDDDYIYAPDEEYEYVPDEEFDDESSAVNIVSAVPGTGAAASLVSAGAGMSGMTLNVPSIASTTEDTAQVAVSKEGGHIHRTYDRPYHFPSLDILSKGKGGSQTSGDEVAHNAMLLENVLSSFGITAKVVNATQGGPTVTRYEIEPAQGVKVSRIVNLTDDIALNLAAQHIRMEAPIPGKSAIGIEVPNKTTEAVHLRDVLDCSDFKDARGGIPVGGLVRTLRVSRSLRIWQKCLTYWWQGQRVPVNPFV